jgi:hypothetical protein
MLLLVSSRNHSLLKWSLGAGILLGIAGVVYTLVHYPAVLNSSPEQSIIYLSILALIFGFYGWLVFRRIRPISNASAFALGLGTIFGLLFGGLWIAELWAGNLAYSGPGWFKLIYFGSFFSVLALTVVVGLLGTLRTGRIETGIMVGLWSGLISGLITFLAILFIITNYMGVLQQDPENIQQFVRSKLPDIQTFIVGDFMEAAINHLWLGPVVGAGLGAFGGWIGKQLRQPPNIWV